MWPLQKKNLLPFELSHMIDWMPYDGDFQLITYEIIWANMFHNVGGEILGGLNFILPLEGNIIAAQVHISLHTYCKWRRGQRGVGYEAYMFKFPTHLFYMDSRWRMISRSCLVGR